MGLLSVWLGIPCIYASVIHTSTLLVSQSPDTHFLQSKSPYISHLIMLLRRSSVQSFHNALHCGPTQKMILGPKEHCSEPFWFLLLWMCHSLRNYKCTLSHVFYKPTYLPVWKTHSFQRQGYQSPNIYILQLKSPWTQVWIWQAWSCCLLYASSLPWTWPESMEKICSWWQPVWAHLGHDPQMEIRVTHDGSLVRLTLEMI